MRAPSEHVHMWGLLKIAGCFLDSWARAVFGRFIQLEGPTFEKFPCGYLHKLGLLSGVDEECYQLFILARTELHWSQPYMSHSLNSLEGVI